MGEPNNFGSVSVDYNAARRGYPGELYSYLHSLVQQVTPNTLDIGCGTGISTRELQQYGFNVVGVDKDPVMLEAARQRGGNISYLVAPADTLPFSAEQFDVGVAFTAFHWFNNLESLMEIRRVLRRGGVFFAALKGNRKTAETKDFMAGYEAILEKYAGKNFDSTKNHFNTGLLAKLFTNITEKSFYLDERYTTDEALTLIRSLSIWNLVSEADKPNMLQELEIFYKGHLVDGFVVRRREIFTIVAYKE